MRRGRYIFDGARQEVERMDDAVFWRDLWLSQVLVVEIEGVADADSLGGGIYEFVAAVVVER